MQFNWPSKKTGEILDYKLDWVDALDGDSIALSSWSVVSSGSGLTINTDSHTVSATSVWISGGNVGTWTLKNTVNTTGGRTYEILAKLPVRA